jgi:outer membrane beta-barrel protein
VRGLRLGYDITEDFFVQGVYGQTKVSDEAFRQVLPGGVFEQEKEKLSYYNLSVGYNVLPGEVFIGGRHAKPSALYLIAGVGSTRFVDRSRQTISFGAGFRVFVSDWAALQLDARNHVFSLDLLGKQQSTHNLEFTAGATFIF